MRNEEMETTSTSTLSDHLTLKGGKNEGAAVDQRIKERYFLKMEDD